MIETVLGDEYKITDYRFGRSKKHEHVTWTARGKEHTFNFPATSPDFRAIKNIRSELRRKVKRTLDGEVTHYGNSHYGR